MFLPIHPIGRRPSDFARSPPNTASLGGRRQNISTALSTERRAPANGDGRYLKLAVSLQKRGTRHPTCKTNGSRRTALNVSHEIRITWWGYDSGTTHQVVMCYPSF